MTRSASSGLEGRLDSLKAEGDRRLSARDLAEIIGEVARTLTADLAPLGVADPAPAGGGAPDVASEPRVAEALEALSEIGSAEQGSGRLAELRCEMDEIRAATQAAATAFLAAAERIEEIAGHADMDAEDQGDLYRLATEIFEAAGFQDITGQRISRVAEIMRQVDYHVAVAQAALGDAAAGQSAKTLLETVERVETRKVEYILHGPEQAGTANTQEEIDKILASFD
jgi:chemotaxis protein CheZ